MIRERLEEIGIAIPDTPAPPAGSYVPVTRAGSLVFVSGQIPIRDGTVEFAGKVSDDNITRAQESARLCAINILAQAEAHVGDLEMIEKIISLTGFVNCTSDFVQHPRVINAASDLLVEIFGSQRGSHSRMAVGAASLPLDAMTEISAVILVKD